MGYFPEWETIGFKKLASKTTIMILLEASHRLGFRISAGEMELMMIFGGMF